MDKRHKLKESSTILKTAPWGVKTDDPFFNQVVKLPVGSLSPRSFLDELLELEVELGRERQRSSPDRLIDLDLLYFGQAVRRKPECRLPHPRIHRRPFVLKSMVELSPNFLHPVLHRTQTALLAQARERSD